MGIGREGRPEAGKVGWVHNAQGLEWQLMGFPFTWYETGVTEYFHSVTKYLGGTPVFWAQF